jgi:hypothetical protein
MAAGIGMVIWGKAFNDLKFCEYVSSIAAVAKTLPARYTACI